VSVRAQLPGGRLTKWYSAGVWAADRSTVARHSVKDQGDADANLATDTLVIGDGKPAAEALQMKVRFMTARPDAVPSLRLAAVAVSNTPARRPIPTRATRPDGTRFSTCRAARSGTPTVIRAGARRRRCR
jgi:hypothetical protein